MKRLFAMLLCLCMALGLAACGGGTAAPSESGGDGKSFTVRSVPPCFAQSDTPHHWEVTLE